MGMGCSSSSAAVDESGARAGGGEAQREHASEAPTVRVVRRPFAAEAADDNRPMAGTRPLLLPPTTYQTPTPLTREELERERGDFWATRVTGIPEVWNYLKMACDALLEADEGTANAILEAANVRTPAGNLGLCYDERGGEYRVPEFCFSTPVATENEDDDDDDDKKKKSKSKHSGGGGENGGGENGGDGKEVEVSPAVPLQLRVRVAGYQRDFSLGSGGSGVVLGGAGVGGGGGDSGSADKKEEGDGGGAAGSGNSLTDLTTVHELKVLLEKAVREHGEAAGGPAAAAAKSEEEGKWGGGGLPVARMRLISKGRTLNAGGDTLRQHGVKDKALLQVFPRPARAAE